MSYLIELIELPGLYHNSDGLFWVNSKINADTANFQIPFACPHSLNDLYSKFLWVYYKDVEAISSRQMGNKRSVSELSDVQSLITLFPCIQLVSWNVLGHFSNEFINYSLNLSDFYSTADSCHLAAASSSQLASLEQNGHNWSANSRRTEAFLHTMQSFLFFY